jgi:stage II sporulation protein AA (anti-sigma F factor antagonist)
MKILTSSAENEVVLIEVEGEIDAHTARQLDKTLNDLLAQGHSRLVLDASQMGFISSAGLRAIMFAHREAYSRGGQLRVCGLSAQARRIFEMARLDEYLHFTDARQEAMEGW